MSYHSDHDPIGNTFREDAGARSQAACGAGELRHLLQHIAEHIANADVRQQAALNEMQSRLVHLADEAQAVRAVVPPEFATAFARIEEGISTLTRRIATSGGARAAHPGRENWNELPQTEHVNSLHSYDKPAHRRPGETDRSRATSAAPPPLRSAATAHAEHGHWDRGPARAYSHPSAGAYGSGAQVDDPEGDWDRASAEALTRLYEPEHAGGAYASAQYRAHDVPTLGRARANTTHGEFGSQNREPERGEGAREHWANQPAHRLEQRFAEIAARIEQALANMRPESSVAALEARLSSFERKMGSAFEGLATREDLAKLQTVEAHIGELAQHVDQAQSQLARLDQIEFNLGRLIDHLSDERLARLFEQRLMSEPHIARIAGAVTDRLAERDLLHSGFAGEMDRLAELRDVIEHYVSSRRQGDEHMASALETIQQAILNLLDRMEALEQVSARPHVGTMSTIDERAHFENAQLGRVTSAADYRFPGEDAGPFSAASAPAVLGEGARLGSKPRSGIGEEIEQARAAAQAEKPAHHPVTAADSHANTPEKGQDTRTEAAPLQASREDFLAAARRAARKASSQAAEEQVAGVRPGIRQRAAAGESRTAARPVTGLIVATLAVALAVGLGLTTYSIYKNGMVNPLSFQRSGVTWGLGDSDEPAAGATARGAAAGGVAGSEGSDVSVGGAGGESDSSEAGGTPEVIIDDPPTSPGAPAIQQGKERTRTVTGVPGGIILDNRLGASPEELARAERQRTLAHLSTGLGAAQAGVGSIPAALIPQAGEGLSAPSGQSQQPSLSSRMMPPAAVGPLSLRLAAANGDPSAEFEVAVRLAEGKGVQQDLQEAVTWYQRAASRGFAPAQYRLGTLYERGLGVNADRGRAMAWYRSAAEKGNLKAMHNFAVMSASGNPADYRMAAHWFGEAAARGLADSQYNMAVLYETGRGVDRDLKLAYKWFALAARGGDKEAARRRDRAKALLDVKQLKAAEALVRAWSPIPAEPLVNNARTAGEAWKRREVQG